MNVTISMPRPDAITLITLLNGALAAPGPVAKKQALLDLMSPIEQGLNDSPEAWWRWAQEACA